MLDLPNLVVQVSWMGDVMYAYVANGKGGQHGVLRGLGLSSSRHVFFSLFRSPSQGTDGHGHDSSRDTPLHQFPSFLTTAYHLLAFKEREMNHTKSFYINPAMVS